MTAFTRLVAAILMLGTLAHLRNATAQCATDETPATVASAGIQGTIESARPMPNNERAITISIKLRNLTQYTAHILTVGNYKISSSAGALLDKYEDSGLNFCKQSASDKENPSACLRVEADQISAFNEIPPCKSIRGTMAFTGYNGIDLKSGDSILNYTYKGIVRFSPVETDPLLIDKPPGPPHIVTLVFPPQPIH